MQACGPYYILKIKDDFSQKQRKNPRYSLRSYARDLDLHPSTLSQVLNGNRGLPYVSAETVANKLKLRPKEKTLFLESFLRTRTQIDSIQISKLDERYMLDESYFKVISEWEHYAVLELLNIPEFTLNEREISLRLGITLARSEMVLNHLVQTGLLIQNAEGAFTKTYNDIRTTEDIESQALQKSHEESLQIAAEK